jgi:hypothetical protein
MGRSTSTDSIMDIKQIVNSKGAKGAAAAAAANGAAQDLQPTAFHFRIPALNAGILLTILNTLDILLQDSDN